MTTSAPQWPGQEGVQERGSDPSSSSAGPGPVLRVPKDCAEVGRELWADTLGPEGSSGATYLESIASNTRAMVDGVTDGAVSCKLPSA